MDNNDRTLQAEQNLNLLQAMRTVYFWTLFLAMACGMGSGLAAVNNVSQTGGSLGSSAMRQVLWFLCGAFGIFLAVLEQATYQIIFCTQEDVQGHCSWSSC
nr:hypothetical protein CFP56_17547 [Quercus suber]